VLQLLSALLIALQVPGLKLEGRVVDASGAPRPAHVVIGSQAESFRDPFELLCSTVAAPDGSFALELPRAWIDRASGFLPLQVFAYLEGYGLATQTWDVGDVPAGARFELRLASAASTRVRFVDADGRAVAGARAWVETLSDPERIQFRMPAAWWRDHASITDADGWATLPVAAEKMQRVAVESETLDYQSFFPSKPSDDAVASELQVLSTAQRALAIEAPLPPGSTVRIETFQTHDHSPSYIAHFENEHTATEHLLTVLVPLEHPIVSIATVDASALAYGDVQVGAGSEPLRLVRRPTYRVTGRTVDKVSAEPVPGVVLVLRAAWPWHQGRVTSGPDGRFAFDCASPGFSIEAMHGSEGYAHDITPFGVTGKRPTDGSGLDLGDVPVAPVWTAQGVVMGPNGKPVAGAWVFARFALPERMGRRWVSLSTITDASGRYELRGARESTELDVSARFGECCANASQSPGEPIELVLAPALCARGMVRDTSGKAVPGLELQLWSASPERVTGGEKQVVLGGASSFRTSADGSFASPGGLDPKQTYCLVWDDARIEKGRSDWFTGAAFARGVDLTLPALATVYGKLLAADGAPLSGVEVRLRRGSASAVSSADGSFELAGASAAGDVLVARTPDGASRVQWVDAANDSLEWRLDAEAALEKPLAQAPAHDRQRELALAVELLEPEVRAAVDAKDESRILRAVEQLAWADPALVLDRVEAGLFETPWMRDFALSYVADALRVEAPQEALAVASRLERGMSRALSELKSAERLDRPAELEQLALVRAEARGIDPPEHRAVVLARLADRLLDLGEREAALDVLDEARKVADSLPREDWPGYARCCVGEILARVDRAAGRALVDSLATANDRGRHLFNTAHELAASDPAACQALIEEQEGKSTTWTVDRYIARIAHRMAPVDLPRARALAARYDRTGFADGMIALALVDTDPMQARASLEQAFKRAEQCAKGSTTWREHPLAGAAALLPVAERVDPTNLRSYVARALAVRRPAQSDPFHGSEAVWSEDATLAFYLARWEPEHARRVLAPAVDAARQVRGSQATYDWDAVWAALVAVDPEWAAQVAREVGGRAARVTGRVLAMPPEQRADYVQDEIFQMWIVGKEDI